MNSMKNQLSVICVRQFNDFSFLCMSDLDVCDLAGNEASSSTGKQLIETCNINTSLMTFKDCIRILNENQTTK
jgi:hypothetical protein